MEKSHFRWTTFRGAGQGNCVPNTFSQSFADNMQNTELYKALGENTISPHTGPTLLLHDVSSQRRVTAHAAKNNWSQIYRHFDEIRSPCEPDDQCSSGAGPRVSSEIHEWKLSGEKEAQHSTPVKKTK
jgi:hypothetical protein